MIGLVVLAVLAAALIGLGAFASPGLAILVPALAIPDVGRNLLGVLAIPASVIGIIVASFYSFRLVSPLVRAFTSRRKLPVLSVSEKYQEENAAAECNERLRRAISYRSALSGLLRPEAYPITCPERTK
jgi:membrane protein implicated in regulation of membrane protease activity